VFGKQNLVVLLAFRNRTFQQTWQILKLQETYNRPDSNLMFVRMCIIIQFK